MTKRIRLVVALSAIWICADIVMCITSTVIHVVISAPIVELFGLIDYEETDIRRTCKQGTFLCGKR